MRKKHFNREDCLFNGSRRRLHIFGTFNYNRKKHDLWPQQKTTLVITTIYGRLKRFGYIIFTKLLNNVIQAKLRKTMAIKNGKTKTRINKF